MSAITASPPSLGAQSLSFLLHVPLGAQDVHLVDLVAR